MSTEPFIGEIKILGFNFSPRGYMDCRGQILSIAQNTALFSLLGTYYGGNGQTTFALPNLQGRMPIGQGQGPGLPSHVLGEVSGVTSTTILQSNMPAHVHPATGISISVPASEGGADTDSPTNAVLANAIPGFYASGTNGSAAPIVASGVTTVTGSSMPIGIENPYLTLNYSIATQGIFPSRN
ncbi:phage tail protein [Flavobacterium ranwuense]|uniref:Phage tail protein n=1 Tax=Flavobacterium ranwuense TaxID=2541725 RepID=A0ABY2DPJ2_9FLAO|nr:tail fiber protein [Flavobacterium ranwuense]TDE28228.1 phage tail protein [Flavobacterium ranwuense]